MNVGGTRHALELAEALQVGCFHQVARSPLPGSTTGRSTRPCSMRDRPSPRRTTAPSSSPRSWSATRRPCPGASTGPRSWSATARPARWTRWTGPTTCSPRSRCSATPCPPGCRWSASTSATPTWCRSTTSLPRSTISPTSRAATARPSTSSTPSRSPSSRCSTPSAAPPGRRSSRRPRPRHRWRPARPGARPAPSAPARDQPGPHRAGADAPRPDPRPDRHPRRGAGAHVFRPVFDSRRTEKALAGSASPSPTWSPTPAPCGATGRTTSTSRPATTRPRARR